MDITPASSATQRAATPAPEPRNNALSSDFETFLRMLTVQMKNQDPLNPTESTDFAVQLATFSGVEQQVKTNELLGQMTEGGSASGLSDFAGWIGKSVRSPAAARFDGAPLTLHPSAAPAPGQTGFLVVRDVTSLPVARTPVPAGDEPVSWAGVRPDGTPFPAGLYRFELEMEEAGSVVSTAPVEHYASVVEVRTGENGPVLLLPGDVTVPTTRVTAVRDAG